MKKRSLILVLLVLTFVTNSFSAKPKTSRYEFWWGVAHPFASIKVKKAYKKASPFYEANDTKLQLDTFTHDGKLDAFRHVYYMAAFAQKVKAKKLVKLGKAHEKTNYLHFKRNKDKAVLVADSMSCVMDLMNNDLGIKLGQENKKLSLEELKVKVIQLIKADGVYYILRDNNGDFIDCNNKPIDLKAYTGKWFVPKCLMGYKDMQANP